MSIFSFGKKTKYGEAIFCLQYIGILLLLYEAGPGGGAISVGVAIFFYGVKTREDREREFNGLSDKCKKAGGIKNTLFLVQNVGLLLPS